MGDERTQFRVLYRDFLGRIVDVELISAGGEMRKLLGQCGAMLAAFSLVLTVWMVPKAAMSGLPPERLGPAVAPIEDFLIATTMAAAGLLALLAWNTVLPDRRECVVLGLLPIRPRTIFLAKAAALATALGVAVGAVNCFTGLSFPAVMGHGFAGTLRAYAAYWVTMAAGGLFVGCALLAVQGLLLETLPYRLFPRVSGWVQLAAFAGLLGLYFLKPPVAQAWPVQSWFFALLQTLKGTPRPGAGRAVLSLLAASLTAAATFAAAYGRHLRRIPEQPDIAPADRTRRAAGWVNGLTKAWSGEPVTRAILLFTARTIARSRQHRLLLAAYMGIGAAIALAYLRDLIYRSPSFDRLYARERWNEVNGPFLVGSLVLLWFALLGTRAVFTLPVALPANWIFRMTAVHSPARYFAAVRTALYVLAAGPVWLAAAASYFAIWPAAGAAQHVAILLAVGVLVAELLMFGFRKIPFACSYLPGKANLQVRLGAGGIGFLFAASEGVQIEYWAMQRPLRFAVLLLLLTVLAAWARRRTTEFAGIRGQRLQFEDLPPNELMGLALRPDAGGGADEVYLEPPKRAFGLARLRWRRSE